MNASRRAPVSVDGLLAGDHIELTWSAGGAAGRCRFDRLVDTDPPWLGSAEELLGDVDRRTEQRVLDAVADWATAHGVTLALWHDDDGIETIA